MRKQHASLYARAFTALALVACAPQPAPVSAPPAQTAPASWLPPPPRVSASPEPAATAVPPAASTQATDDANTPPLPARDPEGDPPSFKGVTDFTGRMTRPIIPGSPPLTREAVQKHVYGFLLVRCLVKRDGTVSACRVLKSLPPLDQPWVDWLLHTKVTPVTFDGVPIDCVVTIPFKVSPAP